MRILEVAIMFGLVLALAGTFLPQDRCPSWLRMLPWTVLALIVLHLAVEHYRWQMVPAYALAIVLALRTGLTRRDAEAPAVPSAWRTVTRVVGAGSGLLTVGLTVLLATGFPIFSYPPPTGRYAVGSTRLFFVDSSRADPFAPKPGTPRELLTNVWYPADAVPGAKPEPFWPADANPSQGSGVPAFVFSHVPLVPSHSAQGIALARAAARYPVIIYSHGYLASIWQNVPQMEELASHGFIVVSIGHTYDASMLTFPDGRIVRGNVGTRAPAMTPADAAEYPKAMARLKATKGTEPIRQAWRETLAYLQRARYPVLPSGPVWVADTRFVMDQLAAVDAGTATGIVGDTKRFAGRLDLERLGVAGMSFGGSTAGSVCAIDARCKAGLNFDGSQFGDVIDTPLKVPFMYFTNATNNEFPVYLGASADLYEVHVTGSTHGNFTDLSLVMPLFTWISAKLPVMGTIGAPEMERIMTDYSVAFFEHYLVGRPAPVLDGPANRLTFPSVTFSVHRAIPVPDSTGSARR